MNTAREQFVEDYTLVVDNDFNGYTEVKDLVESTNGNPEQLELVKQSLATQFEKFVSELAHYADENYSETGADLIRQMLFNQGEAWYDIARHYINNFNESN